MPPAPSSACLKRQLGPQWQNPSLKKTVHRCAELLPAPSPLLPAKPGLVVVAVEACAAAAATAGPCLLEAREAVPGLEKLRLPALLPQAAALVALSPCFPRTRRSGPPGANPITSKARKARSLCSSVVGPGLAASPTLSARCPQRAAEWRR